MQKIGVPSCEGDCICSFTLAQPFMMSPYIISLGGPSKEILVRCRLVLPLELECD